MDFILGENSFNVKKKIIKWDANILKRMHTFGETLIGQELLEEGATFLEDTEISNPALFSKLYKFGTVSGLDIDNYQQI